MTAATADLDATLVIRDVIQRVYGDATQTTLDDVAAREIVKSLRSLGWASLDEVARLIAAAGGEVTVTDRLMLSGEDYVVERFEDYAQGGTKFRARPAR